MSSGDMQYLATPWGLYSQQQFFLSLAFHHWLKGQTVVVGESPTSAVNAVYNNFYSTAWPLVEALDL